MQAQEFEIDFYVLPIKGPELVLGIQWLQLLGTVAQDFFTPFMEFRWKGQKIRLIGEDSIGGGKINFHQLHALLKKDEVQGMFELIAMQADDVEQGSTNEEVIQFPSNLPEEVLKVLKRYERIFQIPKTLPPFRSLSHKIHLSPNTKPVNIRPYRYPHFQKNKIEKLVKEMLEQGLVRPSQSPFRHLFCWLKRKMVFFVFVWIIEL